MIRAPIDKPAWHQYSFMPEWQSVKEQLDGQAEVILVGV
jgi:hypothetical protein|tara:strand:+ start:1501 stop:1617 length:117 start_codon:yes stop_codon:yes gene_type:complete